MSTPSDSKSALVNPKTSILFKVGSITAIALLLLVPAAMVENLVHDRESTQRKAIAEVSSSWARAQTITGPVLSIPYYRNTREKSVENGTERMVRTLSHIHLLPSELLVSGRMDPEQRNRGIYEVVVYQSKLEIRGAFDQLDLSALDIPAADILFDKAEFVVGIDDLRGIEEQVTLAWNEERIPFNPGVSSKDVVPTGINALLDLDARPGMRYTFALSLDLKGSQKLHFTPVGKVTDIDLASDWTNPSFQGAFLPDHRAVSDSGFTANWNVIHLNRNFPQVWTGSSHKVGESAFGIDLLIPVDNYRKSHRAMRYAIITIALTFLVFFYIEVLNRKFIHPIQYILVGITLVVFYSLLLGLSEHVHFNLAYAASAAATLLLIGGYVRAILKSVNMALVLTGILTTLYTFIFVIIQLQDYALLIGSIGIFLILGVVMYYSRKIDWYHLDLGEKSPEADA